MATSLPKDARHLAEADSPDRDSGEYESWLAKVQAVRQGAFEDSAESSDTCPPTKNSKISGEKERRYTCDNCPGTFTSAGIAMRHKKRCRVLKSKYRCQQLSCEQTFESARERAVHERFEHAAVPRREDALPHTFRCTVAGCEESFTTRKYRQHHVRHTHPEACPFRCIECNTGYFDDLYLSMHRAASHSPEASSRGSSRAPLQLTCRIDGCLEDFSSAEAKAGHMRKTHPFECTFHCKECKVGFGSDLGLTRHYLRADVHKKQ